MLAEAVRGDYFWLTGLDKELLMLTKKKNWPGKNVMGKMLTEVRESLLQVRNDKKLTRSKEQTEQNGASSGSDSEYDTS